jgi:hypothetical protein
MVTFVTDLIGVGHQRWTLYAVLGYGVDQSHLER